MSSSISGEYRDGPNGTIRASEQGTDPNPPPRSPAPIARSAPQAPPGPLRGLGPMESQPVDQAAHTGKSARFAQCCAGPRTQFDSARMEDKARAALGRTFDPAESAAKFAELLKLPPDQRKAAFEKWIDNRMFELAPDEHPVYERYGLKLLGRGGSQIVYSNDKHPNTAIKANFGDIRHLISVISGTSSSTTRNLRDGASITFRKTCRQTGRASCERSTGRRSRHAGSSVGMCFAAACIGPRYPYRVASSVRFGTR